jgi:hypothetical protein
MSKPANTYMNLLDGPNKSFKAADLQELDAAFNTWPLFNQYQITRVPDGYANNKNYSPDILAKMKSQLIESDQTLLGMYHRFATEQMIFLRIERYTHERADFRSLCPMLANDIQSPFKDCLIYMAFEIENGKVRFKIGQTRSPWKTRYHLYKDAHPNLELVAAFNSCLIVEKFLLFLCKSANMKNINLRGEW